MEDLLVREGPVILIPEIEKSDTLEIDFGNDESFVGERLVTDN
jgi:hypothetical protein